MGKTISGATQKLVVDGTVIGREDGLTGFTLTPTTDNFTTTSEGVTVTQNAGGVALEGSFSVLETENTQTVFLGKNGLRQSLDWSRQDTPFLNKECVVLVEHAFEDRGPRRFNVTFFVDGEPT